MHRLANKPNVALIGGGLSGVVAARLLAEEGAQVTLFEAARGLGGRSSTRRVNPPSDPATTLYFDHGLPGLYAGQPSTSATGQRFTDLLKTWETLGYIEKWDNGSPHWYSAVPNGNSLCVSIAKHPGIQQRIQTRVVSLKFLEQQAKWELGVRASDGTPNVLTPQGPFDGVIISDKQAVSQFSVRQYGETPLLESPGLPAGTRALAEAMKSVGQVPKFTLMVAFKAEGLGFGRLRVSDRSQILETITNEASKPQRAAKMPGYTCVVVNSTEAYAVDRIGAQLTVKGSGQHSNLLDLVADEMTAELLKVHPELQGKEIAYKVAHRWGACFPKDMASFGSLIAKGERIGVCGDFVNVEGTEATKDNVFIKNAIYSAIQAAEGLVAELGGARNAKL